MHEAWTLFALACALASLPGTLLLLLLSAAALASLLRPSPRLPGRAKGRIAVVVPAHNEESTIGECVRSLREAILADGESELVVVADRCSDRTVAVARALGARVLVRDDESQRGKGFVLRDAWQQLHTEPFVALAVVDADSVVDRNFVCEIRKHLHGDADAVQVRNLGRNVGDSARTRLLALALCAMNLVRPLGRERLGLSVGIFGNGFAVRREALERVTFSGSLAEDLDFHIRLVIGGYRVRFVDSTSVRSELLSWGRAARGQRARWEGGHLNLSVKWVPRLLRGVAAGRLHLLEPLLEMLLLPLAFHTALLSLLLVLPWTPGRIWAAFGFAVLAFHVALAAHLGGKLRDLAVLPAVPLYLLWKVSLLRRIVAAAHPKASWERAPRRSDTERWGQS